MPQIAQLAETYASQIFWMLVIFGLVFFVVGRGMVPRVLDTVGDRDRQIAADLAAAQGARDAADEQEAAWRKRENENRAEAHALLVAAKGKAAAESEARLAAAQAQIDARMTEAEQRIEAARQAATGEIENVAGEATRDIVRRVAAVEIDEGTAAAAVREALIHG
jgi:F-type H+-transporting ATPase subunit b